MQRDSPRRTIFSAMKTSSSLLTLIRIATTESMMLLTKIVPMSPNIMRMKTPTLAALIRSSIDRTVMQPPAKDKAIGRIRAELLVRLVMLGLGPWHLPSMRRDGRQECGRIAHRADSVEKSDKKSQPRQGM